MLGDGPSSAVYARSLRLPQSSPADPQLWLAQVNSQFPIYRITTQAQQFHHVSASLPPEIAAEVRDFLITPPASAPFETLAAVLIKRTAASKELICSEELGDHKLTQLLRWLQQLLGDKAAIFDQAFLRDFFIQRSPSSHPGKPPTTPLEAASGVTSESSHLFFIRDHISGLRFLVDTGAQLSVLPCSITPSHSRRTGPSLQAANLNLIAMYGEHALTLNLDLRRVFRWVFLVADVRYSILGADFLLYYNLLVNMHSKCLADGTPNLSVQGLRLREPLASIPSPHQSACEILLDECPPLLCPSNFLLPVKRQVTHHIVTTGPLTHARARRLAPGRLQITRNEFEHMLVLGIIRPSSSPWAPPLHMIINKAKCEIGMSELDFLGHRVNSSGIRPLPSKVQVIQDVPQPASILKLHEFFGLIKFYRLFIPHCVALLESLTDMLLGKKTNFAQQTWSSAPLDYFQAAKSNLFGLAFLAHLRPDAPLRLMTNASDSGVGAVLHQLVDGSWSLLSFFSRKFSAAESRYSTFGCELFAMYMSVPLFKHLLEGRPFRIVTDHKPLIFAIQSGSGKFSPREVRHLSYVAEFRTGIRHVQGVDNAPADALSRVTASLASAAPPLNLDTAALAKAQQHDSKVMYLCKNPRSLVLREYLLPSCPVPIICDTSAGSARPLVPSAFPRLVFDALHSLSHPGIRATQHLLTKRYAWLTVNKDVRGWAFGVIVIQEISALTEAVLNHDDFIACLIVLVVATSFIGIIALLILTGDPAHRGPPLDDCTSESCRQALRDLDLLINPHANPSGILQPRLPQRATEDCSCQRNSCNLPSLRNQRTHATYQLDAERHEQC
ncbi:uncharacterized protein LOC144124017 [Amblyomma americanum]